jgi:hypothetical protein
VSHGCSVNFKQTFESKGVLDAKQRLLRVSGDVREPFPAAVRLNIFLHSLVTPAKFGDASIYAFVGHNVSPAQHRPRADTSPWHEAGVSSGSVGVARQKNHAVFIHTQVAEAKVDTLVMKHFLSGFSDADAKLILKHCKEVLPRHANILLLQVRLISRLLTHKNHYLHRLLIQQSHIALSIRMISAAIRRES